MSRWSAAGFVVLALALGGCSDDPMAVEAQWRLRCPQSGAGVCTPGRSIPRSVAGEEGDPGVTFRCRVEERADGMRSLDLRINDTQGDGGTPGSVELVDVRFQDGQDAVVGRVQLIEEGSEFRGEVGAEAPCQVTNLRVERNEGRAMVGEILCRDVADRVAPSRTRDLTDIDSVSAPATFSVVRCDGI